MSVTARSAAPRKRPAQRRSAETVDRILGEAARIFDERGYHGATTNHIAEAAGVSVGSLYQYFPNKDALLVALAYRHLAVASSAFEEHMRALARDRPPIDTVARSLIELTLVLNDSSRLHALLHDEAPRTPELLAQFDAFTALVVAGVAEHLGRTGAGGSRPERRAASVVAAVDAAVHDVVRRYPPGPERRDAVDDLVTWVVGGVAAA